MPPSRSAPPTIWIIVAIACLFFGGIIGYVIATSSGQATSSAPQAAATGPPAQATPASPPAALVDERQLQAYRDILARDPKNAQAAISLGNMLYDAGRYAEAVPVYRQAFTLSPADINISTDLGTSLWYSGRPDEALAQYDKSLVINPTHGQTLFNRGIVFLDGKNDPKAAIASWQKLLETNPSYPDREHVQHLIDRAKQMGG